MKIIGGIVQKVLSLFSRKAQDWHADMESRRRHTRHDGLHAEVEVGFSNYSIRDWSLGGVSFETAPDSRLTVGERLPVLLHFRFPHGTITIEQPAKVVRTSRRGVAAEFAPMAAETRRQFDRVIDSLHAQRFIESQAA